MHCLSSVLRGWRERLMLRFMLTPFMLRIRRQSFDSGYWQGRSDATSSLVEEASHQYAAGDIMAKAHESLVVAPPPVRGQREWSSEEKFRRTVQGCIAAAYDAGRSCGMVDSHTRALIDRDRETLADKYWQYAVDCICRAAAEAQPEWYRMTWNLTEAGRRIRPREPAIVLTAHGWVGVASYDPLTHYWWERSGDGRQRLVLDVWYVAPLPRMAVAVREREA